MELDENNHKTSTLERIPCKKLLKMVISPKLRNYL